MYLDEASELAARALDIAAFLRKPVFADELVEAIRAAIGTAANPLEGSLASIQPEPAPQPSDASIDGRYPAGTNEIVGELLPVLLRRTQLAYPRQCRQLVVDAAHDAVMEWLEQEVLDEDVTRAHLLQRLLQAAWRNMANLVESERRRCAREERFAIRRPTAEPPPDTARDWETGEQRAGLLALAINETERRGIELLLDDASTEELAKTLGGGELSLEEQQREVKRFKDRIVTRARRRLSKPGGT